MINQTTVYLLAALVGFVAFWYVVRAPKTQVKESKIGVWRERRGNPDGPLSAVSETDVSAGTSSRVPTASSLP
jgi:hypothetical protein